MAGPRRSGAARARARGSGRRTRPPLFPFASKARGNCRSMATTINEVMTHDPRTLTPESTVAEAARFMRDDDVGSLPLVEGSKCIGTVTDRDIVVQVVAESRPFDTPVREI